MIPCALRLAWVGQKCEKPLAGARGLRAGRGRRCPPVPGRTWRSLRTGAPAANNHGEREHGGSLAQTATALTLRLRMRALCWSSQVPYERVGAPVGNQVGVPGLEDDRTAVAAGTARHCTARHCTVLRNMSDTPLVSPSTRSGDADSNATTVPSALTEGCPAGRSLRPPQRSTLTNWRFPVASSSRWTERPAVSPPGCRLPRQTRSARNVALSM